MRQAIPASGAVTRFAANTLLRNAGKIAVSDGAVLSLTDSTAQERDTQLASQRTLALEMIGSIIYRMPHACLVLPVSNAEVLHYHRHLPLTHASSVA